MTLRDSVGQLNIVGDFGHCHSQGIYRTGSFTSGRLWDVLFMAFYAIRTSKDSGDQLQFSLYRVPKDGHLVEAEEVTLKLIVGPGDSGEPVVTIMLPNED